jgi:hypothetical protein
MKVKIFSENNNGPEDLEKQINDFLSTIKMLLYVNVVTESVQGIGYMNVLIFYEEVTKPDNDTINA